MEKSDTKQLTWSEKRFNEETKIDINIIDKTKSVYIFVYVKSKIINIEKFVKGITNIDYPKENITLTFCNLDKSSIEFIDNLHIKDIEQYNEIKFIDINSQSEDNSLIYNWGINDCFEKKIDYYFLIDTELYISNEKILENLMACDKDIIAPFIHKEGTTWDCNFWGDLDENGYYKRSSDFYDIVDGRLKGCFNVPFVRLCYLIKNNVTIMEKINGCYNTNQGIPVDMSFCKFCRYNNIKMYVENINSYGVIKTLKDKIPTTVLRPEFYMFQSDRKEWMNKYCHPDFVKAIGNWKELPVKEICPYAFEFPFFNSLFCDHLIDEVNNLNQWSDGGNSKQKDSRINGVENIPTVDIHMKQIGFREQWEKLLWIIFLI